MSAQILTELARAKVNLDLTVLGRRADGFHELDSLVAFADVGDIVTLDLDGPAGVHVAGPFADGIVGENLASRALALVARAAPGIRLGHVRIDKQLPIASGLGGGSADAAAVLRLLERANPAYADRLDWAALAAQLGSDVPVCLANHACRMTGRGEVLAPLVDFPMLPTVLVNAQSDVPFDKTRRIFAELAASAWNGTPQPVRDGATLDGERRRIRDSSASAVAVFVGYLGQRHNDLEAPALTLIPSLETVLAALRHDRLSNIVRMSGAGPTCFALCRSLDDARAVASRVAARHPGWWVRATQLG